MKKIITLSLSMLSGLAFSQWTTTGNSGTNSNTNFIGTLDNQSLVFRTNNIEKLKITPNGKFIFFNQTSPGQIWDKNLLFGSGVDNYTGSGNVSFGMGALTQNTVGSGNTAIGNNALSLIASGDFNVSLGLNSMRNTDSGSLNTALGINALENFKSGNGNVAVGASGMGSGGLVGDYNISVGASALRYLTSGTANVVIGADAFRAITTGSNNINLGNSNARYITSGNNNIFIGNNITPNNTTSPNDELNIGNWIYGQNGKIGIGGLPDSNLGLKVYGRSQFITDTTSDGIQIHNNLTNVADGSDLVWINYSNHQSNNVGLLTLSAPTDPPTPWYDPIFSVRANGRVLIGASIYANCADCNNYKLFVKDGIKTEKVKVEIATVNGWADYVFNDDYKLRSLEEVEKFVNQNGHLPNIPSANDVVKNGLDLGEMNAKLLEKIEELTLYSIDLNKKNATLNDALQKQQKLIDQLSHKVDQIEKKSK